MKRANGKASVESSTSLGSTPSYQVGKNLFPGEWTKHQRILGASLMSLNQAGLWGLNINLRGDPGTAKTSCMREVSSRLGLSCITVLTSIRPPESFLGIPIVKDGAVHYAPDLWARKAYELAHCVVFFDEGSDAPPAVQSAMLRVFLDRVTGDLE